MNVSSVLLHDIVFSQNVALMLAVVTLILLFIPRSIKVSEYKIYVLHTSQMH